MDESGFSSNDSDAIMLGAIARKHRDQNRCQTFKAYSTVIGGFIFMLFPGSLYILGNISPYITSYFRLEDSSKASQILPTILAMNVFIMPLGTMLVQRNWNPKKLIFFAGFVTMLLLAGATFCQSKFLAFSVMYAAAFAFN